MAKKWKKKPSQENLDTFFSDENLLNAVKLAQKTRLDSPDAERERRELAAAVTISRYGNEPIDKRIDETLDEPGERQITSRWLNDDIARWIMDVSKFGWRWTGCKPDELSNINWKSEFAYFVYVHIS